MTRWLDRQRGWRLALAFWCFYVPLLIAVEVATVLGRDAYTHHHVTPAAVALAAAVGTGTGTFMALLMVPVWGRGRRMREARARQAGSA